jgi:hypothetical protein
MIASLAAEPSGVNAGAKASRSIAGTHLDSREEAGHHRGP